MLQLVLQQVRGDAVRLGVAVRGAGEELVETDGETLDHQVLDDETAGEVLLARGLVEVLAHVRPLRLDHRVVDLEAEVLGELLEEENVLGLFVGLMNGLDLLVDGAHQLHHLGVVVDGHDLAAPSVRHDK